MGTIPLKVGLRAGAVYATHVGPRSLLPLLGAQAGVVLNAELSPKLALQPALVYTQKGYRSDATYEFRQIDGLPNFRRHERITTRLAYLELAVPFVYTFGGTQGLQLLAGVYGAKAAGGRQRYRIESESLDPRFTGGTETGIIHHVEAFGLDAGLNGGLGYRRGSWQAQAVFDWGLVTQSQYHYDRFYNTQTRAGQLTLTYFLSAAPWKKTSNK